MILDPQCYDLWPDPGTTKTTVISEFLKPFDARLMRCFRVSSRVNRPENDDAECSAPVEITQPQGSLGIRLSTCTTAPELIWRWAKNAPESRVVEKPERRRIVVVPQVGGLHHRYQRRAA